MAKKKSLGFLGADGEIFTAKDIKKEPVKSISKKEAKKSGYYDNRSIITKNEVKPTVKANDKNNNKQKTDIRTVKIDSTPNSEGYTKTNQKYGDYKYQDYANKKDYTIYKKDDRSYYYDPKAKTYIDMDTPTMTTAKEDKKQYKEAVKQGYKGKKTYEGINYKKQVQPSKIAEQVELETSGLTEKEKEKYKKSLIRQEKEAGKDLNYVKEDGLIGAAKDVARNVDKNAVEPLARAPQSYDYGKLSQDLSMAYYNEMMGKKSNIKELQRKIDNYNKFNKDIVNSNNMLDEHFKNLPNQIGGMKAGIENAGALGAVGAIGGGAIGAAATKTGAGALVGAEKGAKLLGGAGYVKGQTENTFKLEAGAEYQALIEMGVPKNIAKKEALKVGTENALIESGESVLDLLTFGKASAATAALKEGLLKKYGAEALKKWGVSYLTNVASEGGQEGLQEQRSIAGEKRAAEQAGIERDNSQDVNRIIQAGKAGAFSAALTGGATRIAGMAGSSVFNTTKEAAMNRVQGLNDTERTALTQVAMKKKRGETLNEQDMAVIAVINNKPVDTNIQAQNQVQQIQTAVQNGEITTEQGIQEIQNLTNSLANQNQVQNQPIQAETTQPSMNTQETQNIAQDEHNEVKQVKNKSDLKEVVDEDLYDADIKEVENQIYREEYKLNEDVDDEDGPVGNYWDIDDTYFKLKNGNTLWLETPTEYGKLKNGKTNYNDEIHNKIKMFIEDSNGNIIDEYTLNNEKGEFTREDILNGIKQLTYDDSNKQPEGQIDMFGNVHVSKISDNIETTKPEKNQNSTNNSSFSNENIAEAREDSVAKKLKPEKNKSTNSMENIRQDVEEKTNKKMSKHIETSSKATGTVEDVKNMDYDTIVYESKTHEQSKEQALRELAGKDVDTNVNDIHAKFRGTERLTNVDSAKITELMKQTKELADEAAKNGNDAEYNKRMEQFRTLKGDYAVALSESGQFTEYSKVIKELDPETQVDVLNKFLEREQRRGNKKYEGVKLNEKLVEEYKNAKTDAERDVIIEKLKDDTARQIKITFVDKANEFRFLSMLGNLKTHGRNVFGNLGMYSLQSFKDGVAAIGEDVYDKVSKNGLETRSKTLKPATKEVSQFVSDKVDLFMKDQKSKYNESRGMKGDLEGRTKKFNNNNIIGKALNKLSSINSKALDWEDKYFSSKMTKQAMKGFLTANGIKTDADIAAHPELVAQALDYAIFKGKEATFHQDSTTATAIRNTRDKLYTGSGYSKLGGLAIDATLPFVSTPANIAKNALEYTPIIGFGDINKQLQQAPDNMKVNVFIDSLSKQFSGAALMAVGIYLASLGKVKGSGDDDKEDKTEASLGNASYSIKLGNSTYDLSWLSPTAIPFFEGVEVFNAFKKAKEGDKIKATDTADLIDTLFGTLNPMTDMSVLQSIERVITSVAYGGNAVKSATSTTFSSYLQQYIPTLLSQIAQTGDTKQRNTNTGGNVLEKTFDQIKYKIPGARNTLPEKLDVWGNANKTASNVWQRGIEAFLSPANRKDYKVDKTTKELERLAKETDDTAMLPTVKNKSLRVNGKDYKLKGEDYVDLQRTYGKTAKKNLDKLINSAAYKNANDVEKQSMVRKLYDYASYKAKEKYAKNKGINFDSANQTAFAMVDAFDIPYEKYVENKVSGNESASKMLKKLNKLGLDEAQKGAVMNYFNRAYYVDENELYDTLENSDLSDKQKELISAKYEKTITDKERARYKRADDIGIDYDLYTNFRGFVNSARGESRTGGLTKNQKIINYIQKLPLTANQKQKLWTDYKNNKGFMTYYK